MALNKTMLATHYAAILAQLPTTYTFDGTSYTGARSSVAIDRLIMDAGRLDSYEFTLMTDKSDFTTEPAVDDIITISSTKYRVLAREEDAAGLGLRLHLGHRFSDA